MPGTTRGRLEGSSEGMGGNFERNVRSKGVIRDRERSSEGGREASRKVRSRERRQKDSRE